jgi:YidC/Oxa1 family membrane protein insertase
VSLLRRGGGRRSFDKLDESRRAITFYAEDGSSWPHFEPIVRELTESQGREICYLTSAPDDPILGRDDPKIHAFPIGEGFKRSYAFQMLKVGVLVATVPQLGISVLPRSRFAASMGTSYVYVFHSMVSTHMVYEPDGFDHYDTVLCTGPYMVDEIRRREQLQGLPAKELVEHGYGRLDAIIANAASRPPKEPSEAPVVLVAPSWGPTCIFETRGVPIVEALLDAGFEVIARPHPMTRKKAPASVDALAARFGGNPRFTLEEGVTGQESLLRSDLMVSDWSGAALEYAFGLERPVLFVDVERKVNNPAYGELGIEPFEASVRSRIGRVVAPDDFAALAPAVEDLVGDAPGLAAQIRAVREESIFNVGSSGKVAAEVIGAKADTFLRGRA